MNWAWGVVALCIGVSAAPARALPASSGSPAVSSSEAPSSGATPARTTPPPRAFQRFVLAAASHWGGVGRARLRHAGDDARAFATVLTELGGVYPEQVRYAIDVAPAGFRAALREVSARARAARHEGARVEVLLYYSGHSDERGLLLEGELLPYADLRAALESLDADVRVAVLDSCLSGHMLRHKGGRHRPPFVLDESARVQGSAVLTSSSEDEASQESDVLRGSFFTHALVSGLRGAADASGDGRVTLHEAYRFAFDETLAHTEVARGGVQHPAYDMRLSGTGDLVLTDLTQVSSRLALGVELAGRVSIRDANDRLVVELQKEPGSDVVLGLPSGAYEVRVADARGVREGAVQLEEGREALLALVDWIRVALADTRLRGGHVNPPAFYPVNISFVSPLEVNSFSPSGAENLFGAHLLFGRQRRLYGADVAFGVNYVDEVARGALLALGANLAMGEMTGAQISGFFNLGAGVVVGTQLAPLGVNLSLVDLVGAQVSGLGNLTLGRAVGAQVSPLFNFALDDAALGQVSLLANMGFGRTLGVGLALGSNIHDEVVGAQVAAVNLSRRVVGAQVGLVNIGESLVGPQIGLVNISRRSALPVGLINIIEQGIHAFGAFASDLAPLGLRLQLGGEVLYTAFGVGFDPWRADDAPRGLWQVALGGRVPLAAEPGRLHLDVEAGLGSGVLPVARWVAGPLAGEWLPFARVLLGGRALPWLHMAAGPALYAIAPGISPRALGLSAPPAAADASLGAGSLRFAPGFALTVGL